MPQVQVARCRGRRQVSAKGTIAHRYECPTTMPTVGWPQLPSSCKRFWNNLSSQRQSALRTRGVCMLRLPMPIHQQRSDWQWHGTRPDTTDDTLTWVIDGSRRYGSLWHNAATGCGVAAISSCGELVVYAHATPPSWIKTSNSAEAWALYLVLAECPTPPKVLTDCMALVHTARAGAHAATSHKRVTARVWRLISHTLDGDTTKMVRDGRLVWLPAHQTLHAATARVKSDGKAVTTIGW